MFAQVARNRFFFLCGLIYFALSVWFLIQYFAVSWGEPHYRFFPVSILAFVYILSSRCVDYSDGIQFFQSRFSFFLLLLATLLVIGGSIFGGSYFFVVGFVVFLASCLSMFRSESNLSLFSVSWVLVPVIRIPLSLDLTLMTEMQFVSAQISSSVLDFLNVGNLNIGTLIEVQSNSPNGGVQSFEVERACNGVQSLFALISISVIYGVSKYYTLTRIFILVLTAIFWSVISNAFRIVACVAAYSWFNINIYEGVSHEVLGYFVLLMAVWLIISTDYVLIILLEGVPHNSGNFLVRYWNFLFVPTNEQAELFTQAQEPVTNREKGMLFKQIPSLFLVLMICVSGVALWQQSKERQWEIGGSALSINENSLPDYIDVELGGRYVRWINEKSSYVFEKRERASIFGTYSHFWVYRQEANPNKRVLVSLDYPFGGFHDLERCYISRGWKVGKRIQTLESEYPILATPVGVRWLPTELHMSFMDYELGFCIFSAFGADGAGIDLSEANPIKTQFTKRIFRNIETVQTQCFAQTTGVLNDELKDSMRQIHLQTRELIRELVIKEIRN